MTSKLPPALSSANPSPSRLFQALAFAAHKHRDQRRKGEEAPPYINHLIEIAQLLATVGEVRDEVTLCAAILHDTLEDTETTLEELRACFGEAVAAVVAEVSDDKRLPKAERKRLQVEHAPHLSERARLVKLADKIANLRDILHSPPVGWELARKQEYFDWAKRVVDALRGTHAKLEMLFDEVYAQRPS